MIGIDVLLCSTVHYFSEARHFVVCKAIQHLFVRFLFSAGCLLCLEDFVDLHISPSPGSYLTSARSVQLLEIYITLLWCEFAWIRFHRDPSFPLPWLTIGIQRPLSLNLPGFPNDRCLMPLLHIIIARVRTRRLIFVSLLWRREGLL
jgi:hypothetical protein